MAQEAGTGSTLAKARGAASGAGAGSGARAADDSENGNSEAVCTWAVPGLTFNVFTITGRIGSVEPGDGRAFRPEPLWEDRAAPAC